MTQPTIIAIGELLVEFISHRTGCDLQALGEYSGPYPSGAPAIFIDQVARMGTTSKIIGGLGTDKFGHALLERLQSNGVDTSAVAKHHRKTTGVAFVSYYEDGSRTFIFHLNNTAADSIQENVTALPDGPLLLHVSGSSLGNAVLRVAIRNTAAAVLKRGGKLSCDPNARAELMSDPEVRTVLSYIIDNSSYLFPSTSDLQFLYPQQTEKQIINTLLATGAEFVALKRGCEGSTLYTQENQLSLHAHAVTEVDPTGAGDCYCGTFLAMIAQGETPEAASRYANAAGAIAVTIRGPMEGNSNKETIERFLAQQKNT